MRAPASLWWSTLGSPLKTRPSLRGDLDVDVAIVGAGYSGLWTARELLRRDPHVRIAVLEKAVAGFGASGRNGGWASALYPLDDASFIRRHGRDALIELRTVLRSAVTELGEAISDDGIDADFVQGGSLVFARNAAQQRRLEEYVAYARSLGDQERDVRWLDVHQLRERGYVQGARGATFTPHCARLHPAKLVRGLANNVEHLGATIYEATCVTRIVAGSSKSRPRVVCVEGTVRANYVVRATEGFTVNFSGQRRALAPIYSMMIATEPQSPSFWRSAGFSRFETFSDARHNIIYAQRTADDRFAFGGRGAPYHFGSTVEDRFSEHPPTFRALLATLRELFPELEGGIDYQWGGPLAMPRDHEPSVFVDRTSGLVTMGGYTGDGVVLSRVLALQVADAISESDREAPSSRLPFLQRQPRRWEFEPLRWLGANSAQAFANHLDRAEARDTTSPLAARFLRRILS